jgi:hypothetical protein
LYANTLWKLWPTFETPATRNVVCVFDSTGTFVDSVSGSGRITNGLLFIMPENTCGTTNEICYDWNLDVLSPPQDFVVASGVEDLRTLVGHLVGSEAVLCRDDVLSIFDSSWKLVGNAVLPSGAKQVLADSSLTEPYCLGSHGEFWRFEFTHR